MSFIDDWDMAVLETFIGCLLFGGFAGLLAGLFGIGGGVVLVPFFVWLLADLEVNQDKIMVIAVATSLATIIFTSLSAIVAQHRMRALPWGIVCRLAPSILIGAILGAMIADSLPRQQLQAIFAAYLFFVGLQMATGLTPHFSKLEVSNKFYIIAGLLIGLIAAVLGIGGGTLTVPVMLASGMLMVNAVAVSSACGLPIAFAGTISYGFLGWEQTSLSEGFAGYVYLPAFAGIIVTSLIAAPLGAKLAHRLPAKMLKRCFSLLVFVVATKLVQQLFYITA